IVIGIILNSIDVTGSADSKDGEKETIEVVQEKGNKKNDDDANVKLTDIGSTEFDSQLLLAYRESLTGNKQEAIKVLEGIGYSNLPNPDKEIMLKIYEELKSYAKVISLNPNKAEKIVNIMIADNNTNGIIELQEKLDIENPYINFEVAYLERDFETVI